MVRGATESAVRSAIRIFEILEHFQETRRPLRLKELVERYGYPPSSAADLLKTMVGRGYLSFDRATRSYFPTPRLAALVAWMPTADFEAGPVPQAMLNLSRATGELIVLATPIDVYVEFIDTLRSTQNLQLWRAPGTRLPLVQTGMGMLWLSRLARAKQKDYHRREATRLYRRSISLGVLNGRDFTLDELLQRIEVLRGRDHAFVRSTDYRGTPPGQHGIGMISMLVPCPAHHRPLILGIGGPAERLTANLDAMLRQMRQEIAQIAKSVAATAAQIVPNEQVEIRHSPVAKADDRGSGRRPSRRSSRPRR